MDNVFRPVGRRLANVCKQAMLRHPEICCFLFALVFSLLSRYTRSVTVKPPLTADQPAPRPFFTPHGGQPSPVIDIFHGNIYDVGDILSHEQALVVMYYAPWCSTSKRTRIEYERAAIYFAEEVRFVAINCWYSVGSCKEINRFYAFPVIYAYLGSMDGIKYTGLLRSDYIVSFIRRVMYPLDRIDSYAGLQEYLALRDNAVIGYFDFQPTSQPLGYMQYYYASIRVLEKDPKNVVDFAVITNKQLATVINLLPSQAFWLFRRDNNTIMFPLNGSLNYTSSTITQWVMYNKQHPRVMWLLPSMTKSLVLSTELTKGPALILFTPVKPLGDVQHYYHMLRELSLQTSNITTCSSDPFCEFSNALVEQSVQYRTAAQIEYKYHQMFCQRRSVMEEDLKASKAQKLPQTDHTPNSNIVLPHTESQCCMCVAQNELASPNSCHICTDNLGPKFDLCRPVMSFLPEIFALNIEQFLNKCFQLGGPFSFLSQYFTTCCNNVHSNITGCDQGHDYSTQNTTDSTAPVHSGSTYFGASSDVYVQGHYLPNRRVPLSNISDYPGLSWSCQHSYVSHAFDWIDPEVQLQVDGRTFLSGKPLSDRVTSYYHNTNRSMNFYLMDSEDSSMFADRIGMKLNEEFSGAVIVDIENDAHYLYSDEISKDQILSLIENYTQSSLYRYRHSATPNSKHTPDRSSDCAPNDLCLIEVTTESFERIVLDETKDVVLLYYAPWCSFCAGFAHIYLSLLKYFRSAKNIVFARINADTNDLPWQYTVSNYPTIVLYPAHRKADSIPYPSHIPKTFPKLVGFVLQHSASSLRRDTALSLCKTTCVQNAVTSTANRLNKLKSHASYLEKEISEAQEIAQRLRDKIQTVMREYKENMDGENSKTDESIDSSSRNVADHPTLQNKDSDNSKDSVRNSSKRLMKSEISDFEKDFNQFLTKIPYWSTDDLRSVVVLIRRVNSYVSLLKSKQLHTQHQIVIARRLYNVLVMAKDLQKSSIDRHHVDALKKDQFKQQLQQLIENV